MTEPGLDKEKKEKDSLEVAPADEQKSDPEKSTTEESQSLKVKGGE
ncbi:hypothetical protein H206_01768 [Candidatus Electrothrix aarhusensis]|uniref:Uncharacterized protein n=1 Tax=Candidatus Electrothrix aarhusensis TaxID=1859131 RepID=A0A444IUP4_9BACT|nr:hypothetical protein H206_01768 [Candidatus Electrothrix aarhusensis]